MVPRDSGPGRQLRDSRRRRALRCSRALVDLGAAFPGGFGNEYGDVGNHRLRAAVARLRRPDGARGDGGGCGHAAHAGDRRRHPGRRAGLSDAPIYDHRHRRRRHLPHCRRAIGLACRPWLPDRRHPLGRGRLHRHAGFGARQRAHRAGLDALAGRGPVHGLPRRRRDGHAGGRPGPARRRRLLQHPDHGARHGADQTGRWSTRWWRSASAPP